MTRNGKIALIFGVIVAIIVGIWVSFIVEGRQGASSGQVTSTGQARVGGPFTLTNHLGEVVSDESWRGQYLLLYFGFTFCPDVCPTELSIMANALEALGDKADAIQPLLITIDPERDTPEVLARYVPLFHPRLVGLTGTPEQIAEVGKSYHVYYRKVQDESSAAEYTMDHSSIIFLMGPKGEFLKLFPPATDPDKMAQDIATYLK